MALKLSFFGVLIIFLRMYLVVFFTRVGIFLKGVILLTMASEHRLDTSIYLLQNCLVSLEDAVSEIQKQTKSVGVLQKTLESKMLFDVLPERLILQRPLKIRKMVKPILEKDNKVLGGMVEKCKKKKLVLEQQQKILKLKWETINSYKS